MAPRRLERELALRDAIELRGLRVLGCHGANPGERDRPQPFEIDVVLKLDLAAARRSDELKDTLDYAALDSRIRKIVTTTSFALLERLGQEILDALLADGRVRVAEVSIAKPGLLAGATPVVRVRAKR